MRHWQTSSTESEGSAPDLLQYYQPQPTRMTRALFPIGFCALCLLIGNATLSTIGATLEAEQAEICHRSGSLDCPPLPR